MFLGSRPFLVNPVSNSPDYEQHPVDRCEEDLAASLSKSSLKLELVPLQGSSENVLCDATKGRFRPVVPKSWRNTIFKLVHDLHHPGFEAAVLSVSLRFVWPSMASDVRKWAQNCIPCPTLKIHKYPRSTSGVFAIPIERFQHIHINILGPLPSSNDHTPPDHH